MHLERVGDYATAKRVARGVARYNGVPLTIGRVLRNPHYIIRFRGRLAGWLGYERRGKGYEILHLSVLPKYRRLGLGQRATSLVLLHLARRACPYVYARTKGHNYASQKLLVKLDFKQVAGGRIRTFAKRLR